MAFAAEAALLAGGLLWGLAWWPLKQLGAAGIDSATLVLVSYGAVALLGLPLLWRQRRQWRAQTALLLLVALFGGWANQAIVSALMQGNVVRVMLLFYLAPVWGVLAGWLCLGEALRKRRLLALALALLGAVVLLGGRAMLRTPLALVDLLALSAGFSFALGNVAARAANRVPMASKTLAVFVGCALLAAARAWSQQRGLPSAAPGVWALLLLYALSWLALATLATQYGVSHMQAGRAAVLLILELVVAVVSATLFGHATLSPGEAIGGSLIVGAALLEALDL